MIQKARVAGEAFGLRPAFPYLDAELADYYFNLPEADRFDFAGIASLLPSSLCK